jgi:hypothetical protein
MENNIEKKDTQVVVKNPSIDKILDEKTETAQDIKTALDILTTRTALQREGTIDKLVDEKEEELRNDAEAKRIQAETEKIEKEVEKVKQEKEKQLAELDKVISAKQKEVEKLKVEADKEKTFFESNKDILKYIGIREKKSLRTMQALMFPATIIFIIVQILLFPLTLCGLVLETIVNILGGICGAIKNNALKIILSILVIAVVVGGGFCAYYFGGKLII